MQRRKPASAKQRKAQLQQKRAIKRGDVSPPPPGKPDKRRKGKGKPSIHDPEAGPSGRAIAAAESSRRLQSSFVKLSAEFLEETKRLAANLPLPRPIAPEAAVWNANHDAGTKSTDPAVDKREQLTCPKRPKWRYEMSKKEVEKNEEGLFKKWLDQTDSIIGDWCSPDVKQHSPEATSNDWEAASTPEPEEMPKAPTSFERNLEVWRQLWRVTEISQIILILLDSRCPLLHYPPSLAAFLSSPALSRKRIILVLTKVDISGPERADAWIQYLQTRYPGVRVVQVESYAEKQGTVNGKHVYEPHLPTTFRQRLVDALKETHKELLEPPERIRDIPEKVKTWKPPVKREVHWEAVLNARGGQVGNVVGGATVPKPKTLPDSGQEAEGSADVIDKEEEEELEFLTIGLIGQPNVGKSSLLNALFGTQKVRASRTPGKTKHFQTLFWTPEVRLVDCPGLVMPNLVPMETQVLAGILPISRVSAVPLCIYHAASLLPLETILSLTHPSLSEPKQQDKRTWRVPRSEVQDPGAQNSTIWTAIDILTAFALKKGWVTAKAGRPDVNRAGNFILRALAEGRIKWAFWPPGRPALTLVAHQQSGQGIWIRNDEGEEEEYDDDVDSDVEERRARSKDGSDSEAEDVEDSGDEGEDLAAVNSIRSRFAALRNASGDEEESEEEDNDSTVVNTAASKFGALTVDDLEDDEEESEE